MVRVTVESVVVSGRGDDWYIRMTCSRCGERVVVVWEQLVEDLAVKCGAGHLQPTHLASVFEVSDHWDQ